MGKITKIEPTVKALPKRKKVAAYARVSMETQKLHHSLSAQVSYYSNLIQNNPEWEYAGVYADEAISGTETSNRAEFQRMISDCEAGKIDLVLTKSISRFARNTVDLLKNVRHLKDLGIEVCFEKEGIHSLSGDGEVMLTLLASFAQEESRSISDNCKWGIRKRFEEGQMRNQKLFGYELQKGEMKIIPEQANAIRRIYQLFLEGNPVGRIVGIVRKEGVVGYDGRPIGETSINRILRQEKYTGNAMLQKFYVSNHLTHELEENHGELPRYFVEGALPAIIEKTTFQKAQALLSQKQWRCKDPNRRRMPKYPFSGLLYCNGCGRLLVTSYKNDERIWHCSLHTAHGGLPETRATAVHESDLKQIVLDVLQLDTLDEFEMRQRIERIDVGRKLLHFIFKDGHTEDRKLSKRITGHFGAKHSDITKAKMSRAQKKAWTPERRRKTSQTMKQIRAERGDSWGTRRSKNESNYKN